MKIGRWGRPYRGCSPVNIMATYPQIIEILFCTSATISGAILFPPIKVIMVRLFISGVLSIVVVQGGGRVAWWYA